MEHDKRQHPRYESEGIEACITFEHPLNPPFSNNGDVIDISCTGIKIKLITPLFKISDAKIKIMLVLTGSGTPITIKGIVKHQTHLLVNAAYNMKTALLAKHSTI